jgi:hypothetical protein
VKYLAPEVASSGGGALGSGYQLEADRLINELWREVVELGQFLAAAPGPEVLCQRRRAHVANSWLAEE